MIGNTKINIANPLGYSATNSKPNAIELLAPAANLAVGKAAINAGADALYIGASKFSARAAAGNSMQDIEELCKYARPFGVKVFLALNTLLEGEQELREAKKLALEAIEAGVSAIIFQDVRLLSMNLPVEMHASTQTFVENAERAVAFKRAGVKRLVVERGFTLEEIRAISASVEGVDIEAFVQGAICVGYSGVCSLSHYLTGRSGNRGVCAQPCRSKYDLVDSRGNVLIANSSLLSPKDLDLSARIEDLVEAGVTSLKIEGRLKEEEYVVNNVAYYNQLLNSMGMPRTSWGSSKTRFKPNPRLTFNRDFTQWFIDGVDPRERDGVIENKRGVVAGNVGEYVGRIKEISTRDGYFLLESGSKVKLSNGDGLSFRVEGEEKVYGVRLNKVQRGRLYPLNLRGLSVGTDIFRNSSVDFKPRCERTIGVEILFVRDDTLSYRAIVSSRELGVSYSLVLCYSEREMANNSERMATIIKDSFLKDGGTIFSVKGVRIECEELPFVPMSELNSIRRELFEGMVVELGRWYFEFMDGYSSDHYLKGALPVGNLEPNYLMRTRFCILRECGICLKNRKLNLPLYLENNGRRVELRFDCGSCMMELHRV